MPGNDRHARDHARHHRQELVEIAAGGSASVDDVTELLEAARHGLGSRGVLGVNVDGRAVASARRP